MSTAPATARSSSSASRRESWQPSHEANFRTAILGRLAGMSQLLLVEKRSDPGKRVDRALLADKSGPELAMPAEADRTFHIPFHGEINLFGGDAAPLQFIDRISHHHLGSADVRDGVPRIKLDV